MTWLGVVEKLAPLIDTKGGVKLTSERGGFPKAAAIDASNAPFIDRAYMFRFFSPSLIGDDDEAIILLQGNFGFNTVNGVMDADQPVLANVHFILSQKSGFSEHGSSLTFNASLNETALLSKTGRANLQFEINADFDPVGMGSCSIFANLEVASDGFAQIQGGRTTLVSGDAQIEDPVRSTHVTVFTDP